jgi:hypothetical protein
MSSRERLVQQEEPPLTGSAFRGSQTGGAMDAAICRQLISQICVSAASWRDWEVMIEYVNRLRCCRVCRGVP